MRFYRFYNYWDLGRREAVETPALTVRPACKTSTRRIYREDLVLSAGVYRGGSCPATGAPASHPRIHPRVRSVSPRFTSRHRSERGPALKRHRINSMGKVADRTIPLLLPNGLFLFSTAFRRACRQIIRLGLRSSYGKRVLRRGLSFTGRSSAGTSCASVRSAYDVRAGPGGERHRDKTSEKT